jgi:hypothetical protein
VSSASDSNRQVCFSADLDGCGDAGSRSGLDNRKWSTVDERVECLARFLIFTRSRREDWAIGHARESVD